MATLKSDPNLNTEVGPGTHFSMAYFNTSVAPFTNVDLRIAFNLALNRQDLMNAATDGTGEVKTEFALPGQPGYVKSLDPLFPYNPTEAAQLVKEAGYPNGVSLTCYAQPGQGYDVTGPIIVAEEAAVGINVKLLPGGPTVVAPFFTQTRPRACWLRAAATEIRYTRTSGCGVSPTTTRATSTLALTRTL